uniref:DUF5666 domain-containing protein n=1 Tax=uncultured bacterium contig00018 TaxID=1181509 RepID=A0A806K0V9_9BACT|nr:hypothetical protein [uncultured bacterium contig00018]
MKKLILVIVIACLMILTVSAQNWRAPQTVSVSGTLQLQNGMIAIASGNNAYFVPVLTQYIGFIEGLKEGAQITVNGFLSGNYIQPNTVTIAGKTYDFTPGNNPQGLAYGGYACGYCGGGIMHGGNWGYHGGGYGHHRRW